MGREPDDLNRIALWRGGPTWDPPDPPPPPSHGGDDAQTAPRSGDGSPFGTFERLGAHGVVAGRFLPFHRGHQYLLDFASSSVERLTVLVFERQGDELPGELRARWIRRQYAGGSVTVSVISTRPDDDPISPKRFSKLCGRQVQNATHFFSSEMAYQTHAQRIGAAFVPVDPTRATLPISGSAIRANVMENFRYLVATTRPYFVRRVAVIGAESSGKTTLCARLREQFGALVVPEWARILAGDGDLEADQIQLVARSQIASEDALAGQVVGLNAGILLCDTDLRTVWQWARRLFKPYLTMPQWLEHEIRDRPYDLYLACAPDLPFVGRPDRDRAAERRTFYDTLMKNLDQQRVVELTGSSREERYQTAADAIISLFAPTTLLSRRGAVMAARDTNP